ncbi:hypothetical protein DXG01_004189 [Tephrocybe rancida]|nr:hypothetical protein DXG01_004189 [Tephrocybe rancida]
MFFPSTHRPPLPQEILEPILGHCSPKDLCACSLASSSLRFPAQRALFHKVTLFLYNRPARFNTVDIFLASNARIASYIRHLTLGLSSSSPPPQVLQYLKGLKALTLYAYKFDQADWRAFPAPLTDALSILMQTPEMESLELRNIAHFPLAVVLPLRHLIIFGRWPFDTTTLVPDEGPSQLRSLRVEFHWVLQALLDLPFLDLSRLVRFDAGLGDPTSIETIQCILDGCASTLQDLFLRAYSSDFESHHPLSLSHLTSLMSLSLPLTSPASLKWCTHTLLTLPSSLSILTLNLYIFGPLPTKHSQIDCIALYTQIDALPFRKLYIDRQPSLPGLYVQELEDDDELTLEELLPSSNSAPHLPKFFAYLMGLNALILNIYGLPECDYNWRAYPKTLADVIDALLHRPKVWSLKLHTIASFLLGIALLLTHLVVGGSGPLDLLSVNHHFDLHPVRSLHIRFPDYFRPPPVRPSHTHHELRGIRVQSPRCPHNPTHPHSLRVDAAGLRGDDARP